MSYDLPHQDNTYHSDEKDLFETISEANYLPELTGTHDEALLESFVEKTCEENQVLGQALDKLASLVSGGDYVEEEEEMLLGGAPVADIIDRLEQLSPARNMAAAQGLLHLHHVPEHEVYPTLLPPPPPPPPLPPGPPPPLPPGPPPTDPEPQHFMPLAADNHNATDLQTNYTESDPAQQLHSLPHQSDMTGDLEAIKNEIEYELTESEKTPEFDETEVKCEVEADMSGDHDSDKDSDTTGVELVATDLSIKHANKKSKSVVKITTPLPEISEKIDEPNNFSVDQRIATPLASPPQRVEAQRPPSRESDAMQSPQPSGIPAVPSSPELFTAPPTKSKQQLYLETLLSSPSPKMYTSEVTITKQQCEPLNLGKHRKSASPTVSSCSDEIRKLHKEFGEPQEKRTRRESTEELAKISKVFVSKPSEETHLEARAKKPDKPTHKPVDENSPLKQFQILKANPDFYLPDPLLVPRSKFKDIMTAPGRELPALLIERPELRLPDIFNQPTLLLDPDIVVISLNQLEAALDSASKAKPPEKDKIVKQPPNHKPIEQLSKKTDQPSQPKRASSKDALAGDIDAATATLNQMLWLPYLSQMEAAVACTQNMDFLKAFNSSGYSASNYSEMAQMFNPASRFMSQPAFSMMPPIDYENQVQFAMWQQAMNQANSALQRASSASSDTQTKEPSKTPDLQNPSVHSTKNSQTKPQSSARTSPLVHNYGSACQRNPVNHTSFIQGMYPAMNPTVRPNIPLPSLQIPYFNSNMMSSQRSPRTTHQKGPTSPYYQNNNYLQCLKHQESLREQRSSSAGSQESPRPRISVKSLQNLLEPGASGSGSGGGGTPPARRTSSSSTSSTGAVSGFRREEHEVGSTTPLGETPPVPPLPPHPHDPIHHLWHPLFGNQKGFNSPWSWTTVTATGD